MSEQQLYESFRMSKQQFLCLLDILFEISENIERDDFELSLLLSIKYISRQIVYILVRELFGHPLTSA